MKGPPAQVQWQQQAAVYLLGVKVNEDDGRTVIVTAIDNLVKGASGEAVQNMNIMLGLPEAMGLEILPLTP